MVKTQPITIHKRNIRCIVFFIIALFLSGFRWDVGIDWMSYYNSFGGGILDNDKLSENMEPFNLITCALLQKNGYTDGRYWIWCMALIYLFFMAKSIAIYSRHIMVSIGLYVLMGHYFDSLNMVRQACAIAIGLYSWQFIDKNFSKYCLTILFASLFHTSAIFLFPLYYINRLNITKRKLKVMVIISVLIAPLSTILAPKLILAFPIYQQYGDPSVLKYATGSGNMLSYLRMLFPLFIMYLTLSKWNYIEKSNRRILSICTICGLLCCIAFPTTQIIIRISFYFTIGLIFYLPYLFSLFQTRNRKILWTICIVYYSFFLLINYLLSPVAKIIPFNLRFDMDFYKLLVLSTIILSFLIILTYFITDKKYNGSMQRY